MHPVSGLQPSVALAACMAVEVQDERSKLQDERLLKTCKLLIVMTSAHRLQRRNRVHPLTLEIGEDCARRECRPPPADVVSWRMELEAAANEERFSLGSLQLWHTSRNMVLKQKGINLKKSPSIRLLGECMNRYE